LSEAPREDAALKEQMVRILDEMMKAQDAVAHKRRVDESALGLYGKRARSVCSIVGIVAGCLDCVYGLYQTCGP
jgi:hypothetical protein